ncbi:MAG: hypothetical protein LBQ24_01750 [Candidatus Peribacteria bacterium]|jgi:hypothetical protein|nr:hypothetical protein [Candidatus Peribacteria bacterium]
MISLSFIPFSISFIIVLSCHSIGQELVIIKCSSHFQATSKTSHFFVVAIQASIASFLVVIIKKSSHSSLFIQGKTSFIIFSVFSV